MKNKEPSSPTRFKLKDAQCVAAHQAGGNGEGGLERKASNEVLPLINGGILANKKGLCATAEQVNDLEGKEVNQLHSLFFASFGTSQSESRITPQDGQN